MPGKRCSPPKTVSVKSHSRAGRRKKRKPSAGPKAGTVYYVVENERTHRTTGTKHRTLTAAINARKRLDLVSYRAGQGRPYHVAKRTA